MSTEDMAPESNGQEISAEEAQMQAESPQATVAAAQPATRKRPRLDLAAAGDGGGRERKRGRGMFGLVLGTLNKAKVEDKERNASDAAKKRQLIDQRLQDKLRKETDSVRRAEEAKKDKTSANRREEELQVKDSIYKLRRTRLPLLSNFLLTSDRIPTSDDSSPPPPSKNPLTEAPRSHPPPLYYLPAILTPAQETFLTHRKAEVKEAADKEWELFKEERTAGVEEINGLRQKVAQELDRKKAEAESGDGDNEMNAGDNADAGKPKHDTDPKIEASMEVDDAPVPAGAHEPAVKEEPAAPEEKKTVPTPEVKQESAAGTQADDDDAVEY